MRKYCKIYLLIFIFLPLICYPQEECECSKLKFSKKGVLQKGKPFTGKCYNLYDNGERSSERSYKDGKDHGPFITWYKNGEMKSEYSTYDGVIDGKYTRWYENGQIKEKTTYIKGVKDGECISWYENGRKSLEETFVNGKLDGIFRQ